MKHLPHISILLFLLIFITSCSSYETPNGSSLNISDKAVVKILSPEEAISIAQNSYSDFYSTPSRSEISAKKLPNF